MSAHARLAPSSGSRWVACPGSVALIESLPEDQRDKPNEHSVRGTACHEVLANCLGLDVSPTTMVGHAIAEGDITYAVTAEDIANVQLAMNYVNTRIKEYGAGTEVLIEEKMECGNGFHTSTLDPDDWPEGVPVENLVVYKPRTDSWGTADVVLIGGGYLEVIDYKNGVGYVDEKQNHQMLLYMLGALQQCKPRTVQRIRLTIVQPRAVGHEPVRTWEFPESEAIEWAVRLGNAAEDTAQPDAPRIPGESQCRWCPAKPVCPEVAGTAMAALMGDVPAPVAPEQAGAPLVQPQLDQGLLTALTRAPDQLDAEQLARVLDMEPLIRSWLKSVSEHALKLMLQGQTVPGFKLVSGRRSRGWSVAEEELLKKLGNMNRIGDDGKAAGKLKKDSYTTVSVISPAQAEKTLKPMVTPKTWGNISKLIEVNDGKPTLAPVTDHRRALSISSSAEVFGVVESQPAELPDWMG